MSGGRYTHWWISGDNGQLWEFIAVKDQGTTNKMAGQYLEIQR